MTSTSWHKLFGLSAALGLVAGACTVSSGDTDDDDDTTTGTTISNTSGGSGGSGGSTTTTTTGGSGGTGGSAGADSTTTTGSMTGGSAGMGGDELECLDSASGDVPGTEPGCEMPQTENCCAKCMAAKCCDQYNECFKFNPMNVCGGSTDDDSEYFAFQNCMLSREAAPGLPNDEFGTDFEDCINEATSEVSGPACGLGTISGPTQDLALCLHGDDMADDFPLNGCFSECLDSTFEESSCIY